MVRQIISQKFFSINGNIIGVVLINSQFKKIKTNHQLLTKLIRFGIKNHIDSIGVLKRNNFNNYSLETFEPNSSQQNNQSLWSNTCGNALIAVNRFLQTKNSKLKKIYIKTNSGIKEIINDSHQTTINLGILSFSKSLNQYQKKIINSITNNYEKVDKDIYFGYLSNEKNKIGEPHLMIESKHIRLIRLIKLSNYALKFGPKITNDNCFFKKGINTNIVSIKSINKHRKIIKYYIVTYERNLGDSPKKCITGSCGTGALTTFGFILKKYNLEGDWKGYVISKKGTTCVKNIKNDFFLIDYKDKLEFN